MGLEGVGEARNLCRWKTRRKIAKIIAQGADERQSVADITAEMAKESSRTP